MGFEVNCDPAVLASSVCMRAEVSRALFLDLIVLKPRTSKGNHSFLLVKRKKEMMMMIGMPHKKIECIDNCV
jgi:hypothetical protein